MFNQHTIRANKVSISITLFLIIMASIHVFKPTMIYNTDGSFKPFGLGYRNKTVMPIWVIAIITAILSYLLVLFYTIY